MESSLTQSHIGFVNAAALGVSTPSTPGAYQCRIHTDANHQMLRTASDSAKNQAMQRLLARACGCAVGKHAALAPISENITPRNWQVKRSGTEPGQILAPHTDQPMKMVTPGSGFSESHLRPTVLPRLTDPNRPSTGHLRHGGPHARVGAGTRSQADMNMKMENLLSRARESQAQSRDLHATLPRQPSSATSFRAGRASAYQL